MQDYESLSWRTQKWRITMSDSKESSRMIKKETQFNPLLHVEEKKTKKKLKELGEKKWGVCNCKVMCVTVGNDHVHCLLERLL